MSKQRVGMFFGGYSVEHDISIITALQAMRAVDESKYEIVPVYISNEGQWYTGEALQDLRTYSNKNTITGAAQPAILSPDRKHRGLIVNPLAGRLQKSELLPIDVAFPLVHGTHGEDGTLQGLFELVDLPYVGCGVLASAIGNDKALTKVALMQAGIPVVSDYVLVTRDKWQSDRASVLKQIQENVPMPVYVKPRRLGSSIGVSKCSTQEQLIDGLELGFTIESDVVVEKSIENLTEINCAVLGNDDPIPSVCEKPLTADEVLTFEDKYMSGESQGMGMAGAKRIVPAPISDELTQQIQQLAVSSFKAIDGAGLARIDFLVDGEENVYVNELNTMPGSLSYYLWQEDGIKQPELVDRLIKLALEKHAEKSKTTFSFKSYVLEDFSEHGSKGGKF